MEPFKTDVNCIMAFFIPLACVTLSQFYSIISLVLFTRNNKLWNERKEDFLINMTASAYHVISKEVESAHNDFDWSFQKLPKVNIKIVMSHTRITKTYILHCK